MFLWTLFGTHEPTMITIWTWHFPSRIRIRATWLRCAVSSDGRVIYVARRNNQTFSSIRCNHSSFLHDPALPKFQYGLPKVNAHHQKVDLQPPIHVARLFWAIIWITKYKHLSPKKVANTIYSIYYTVLSIYSRCLYLEKTHPSIISILNPYLSRISIYSR